MLITEQICDSTTCTRSGCGPEAGCKGHAWREMAPPHYRQAAEQLVKDAARDGVVVTLNESVVSVRPARERSNG